MKKLAIFLACVLLFAATATGCQSSGSSKGLELVLSDDGSYYIVNSIGKCKETKVIIPSAYRNKPVKSIGLWAFDDCANITSVTIPNSVTIIDKMAFQSCSSLTSITIPNSVTIIDHGAFGYCTSLTSITIPNSVKSIGDYAFLNCYNLKDVYFTGTEAEWQAITIGFFNTFLTNATIHFNSKN